MLLVGNHSGGNLTPDSGVFTLAFSSYFGVERPFYQLAHNLVLASPWGTMLRKFGTVSASHEHAARRSSRVGRCSSIPAATGRSTAHLGERQGRLQRAQGVHQARLGPNVPIVPVVSIGGQETSLFLSRGDRLARAMRLDKLFRLKVLPVSLAAPWGLNIGDFFGHFPLPAKITIEVLPPIDLHEDSAATPTSTRSTLRHGADAGELDELAAERRLPIVG